MFISEDGIITHDDDVDCPTCDNWGCEDCCGPLPI